MESRTVRRLTTGLLVVASLIMALMPTLEPETAQPNWGPPPPVDRSGPVTDYRSGTRSGDGQ